MNETQIKTKQKSSTSPVIYMTLTALLAAVTAACSWISVPLPFTPVPINLATLAVFLAGGLLGAKYGSISIIIYVLLGAIGVPVFHSFTGGIGIITGPTGGYIIGYIPAALFTGLVSDSVFRIAKQRSETENPVEKTAEAKSGTPDRISYHDTSGHASNAPDKNKKEAVRYFILEFGMIVGLALCYTLGTAWYMHISGIGLAAALLTCVIPFLIGDALKITAAVILVKKIRPFIPCRHTR